MSNFLLGNNCEINSPDDYYYVTNFPPNEPDKQKRCLTDCPNNYPYYIKINSDKNFLFMHECENDWI